MLIDIRKSTRQAQIQVTKTKKVKKIKMKHPLQGKFCSEKYFQIWYCPRFNDLHIDKRKKLVFINTLFFLSMIIVMNCFGKCLSDKIMLTQFMPPVSFILPENKARGFLMFSGGIERDQHDEIR